MGADVVGPAHGEQVPGDLDLDPGPVGGVLGLGKSGRVKLDGPFTLALAVGLEGLEIGARLVERQSEVVAVGGLLGLELFPPARAAVARQGMRELISLLATPEKKGERVQQKIVDEMISEIDFLDKISLI